MPDALFLLQIVQAAAPHQVVRLPAGGPLELELIERCTDAIMAKGVGFGRTEAQVRQAIIGGMTEVVRGLKWQTRKVVV